jgi:hypothetical protein
VCQVQTFSKIASRLSLTCSILARVAIHCGTTSNCYWSYHVGEVSAAAWNRFVERGCRFIVELAGRSQQGVLLTLTRRATPPDATQRKQLADALSRTPEAKRILGHAFVSDSREMLLVLKALDWLVRKPYPEQAFSDAAEAIDWLTARMPNLDARALRDAMRGAIPASSLDPKSDAFLL